MKNRSFLEVHPFLKVHERYKKYIKKIKKYLYNSGLTNYVCHMSAVTLISDNQVYFTKILLNKILENTLEIKYIAIIPEVVGDIGPIYVPCFKIVSMNYGIVQTTYYKDIKINLEELCPKV